MDGLNFLKLFCYSVFSMVVFRSCSFDQILISVLPANLHVLYNLQYKFMEYFGTVSKIIK